MFMSSLICATASAASRRPRAVDFHDKYESVPGENSFRRVGLARALSKLGYCSRSDAVGLICSGRVRLNGVVRRDPEISVRLEKDRIEADGQPLRAIDKVHLMLNKPRGVVVTASDEKGRPTVYSFLDSKIRSGDLPWVVPVGRLDKASEGILLLTNDSEWGDRVLSPGTHLNKTYHVQIRQVADAALLKSLERGVEIKDGTRLRVRTVRILRSGGRNSWLEIVLDEGKNRHIRRMLEHLGVEVLRLVRIAIGPLILGRLPKGGFRALTASEKQAIDLAMERPIPPR